MILFYWTKSVNAQLGGDPNVPDKVSGRIFVNIDTAARWSVGYGKMEFVLDSLCAWGSSDKNEACVDGTTTKSWEFPGDRFELVQTIVEKWKTPGVGMPVWHERSFFFEDAKQSV